MEVKNALNASEVKIQQLLKVNCHLSEELRVMQTKVRRAQSTNSPRSLRYGGVELWRLCISAELSSE